MMKLKFSIITVCLNSGKTISNTIESVLNLSCGNYEYIIVDGKSTDNTLDIIKSFKHRFDNKNIPYKYVSEPDGGIYDAFNKGLKLSKGDWISFLGADDIYMPDVIENINKTFPERKVDFIYGKVKIKGGKLFDGTWSWRKFKRKMSIPHIGSFHNKNYFSKYGIFNTSYKIAGDYELLLRAKEKLKTHKIENVVVLMGNEGISNTAIKKVFTETTRAKRETANISYLVCLLDLFYWRMKYKVKKMMSAENR